MAIRVEAQGSDTFRVEIEAGGRQSVHIVRVDPASMTRYAGGSGAGRLVEASFHFLLEREPASSILSEFEIGVIERYFPEYPAEIRRRLSR